MRIKLISFFWILTIGLLSAQTTEALNLELNNTIITTKILQEQAKQLQAQRDMQEAKKGIIEATKITSKSSDIKGTVTVDDKAGHYAEIMVYGTMIKSAEDFGEQVNKHEEFKKKKPVILIIDSLDYATSDVVAINTEIQINYFNTLVNERYNELKGFEEELKDSKKSSPLNVLSISANLISVVADIASFFKTDVDIKGRTVNIDTVALTAAMAKQITKYEVYLANMRSINRDSSLIKVFSDAIVKVGKIQQLEGYIDRDIAEPLRKANKIHIGKISELETEIKKQTALNTSEANATIEKIKKKIVVEKAKIEKNNIPLNKIIEQFKKDKLAIDTFAEFGKKITNSKEGESSLLVSAVIRSEIKRLKATHLLYPRLVSSGGDIFTSKNSFSSGKIGFMGGSVISYILTDLNGRVVMSDVIAKHDAVRYNLTKDIKALKLD